MAETKDWQVWVKYEGQEDVGRDGGPTTETRATQRVTQLAANPRVVTVYKQKVKGK